MNYLRREVIFFTLFFLFYHFISCESNTKKLPLGTKNELIKVNFFLEDGFPSTKTKIIINGTEYFSCFLYPLNVSGINESFGSFVVLLPKGNNNIELYIEEFPRLIDKKTKKDCKEFSFKKEFYLKENKYNEYSIALIINADTLIIRKKPGKFIRI